MSLENLNEQVRRDLSYISHIGTDWVKPVVHTEGHVYDVAIVGGGQSGLCTAFGLKRERITNITILDENPAGIEGPWITYARMVTLRTPKHLPSIDLGIPSLTFQSWWIAQHGQESWDRMEKVPREEWMNYLKWYREVLELPVQNEVKVELIEPIGEKLYRLHLSGNGAKSNSILTRKVVLATGIQGGGEWHVPDIIKKALPKSLYAHTSEAIDFETLKGKKVGILGGGASAFDNANFALSTGAKEVHTFVRRKEMVRINPMRILEQSGIIERYHTLNDAEKYTAMAHFFKINQPPTNDTFNRASSSEGFELHLDSPWLEVKETEEGAYVRTPHETFIFDYLIISTGLVTDPALRPELKAVEQYITRWGDVYKASPEIANTLIDAHPYLSRGFAFVPNSEEGKAALYGLFAFNYSALISCGISASALSGIRFAIPKLISAIADELFQDDKKEILKDYYEYNIIEFTGNAKIPAN
ncbi:FAD-dependent oxidoreductase [Lysinibacillus telephonicus]|uniref:FAD-dependent oxidoreductase n=1 Tax=Lysinibacillus telephonicus TaxID=1714840 RepID=A0A431UQC1_9BACI|nr:NAD(P)-binding domain-containing protein [Lysinibacillus telephonicus]RTQ91643.1 FAD-dependent oxidoreductase [Lysinibacillus telephonicus]